MSGVAIRQASSRSLEAVLGDQREHLPRPSAGERALLHDRDPVRLRHRGEDGLEVERAQGAQVDHLRVDAVRGEHVRRRDAVVHALHRRHEREAPALARDACAPQRDDLVAADLALERVEALVLEEHHRVLVPNRGLEKTLRVRGGGGRDDLQAGDADEPGDGHLRVDGAEAAARADDGADHEGDALLAAGEEPVLRRLVDQRVHRQGEEVPEHDLEHRPLARDRGAVGRTGHRELRDRRVEHPVGPVLLVQARRHGEHAARGGDVLPEEEHALVAGELLVERLAHGLAELDLDGRAGPRSARRSRGGRRRCRSRRTPAPPRATPTRIRAMTAPSVAVDPSSTTISSSTPSVSAS